ncbi:glutathione S-transferase 1-like isoform X2 [Galleria mellonella]|uniref:Glutathione S-transferase 1-like isoform X2 n=1 Tax=Galleria mellonella TaxID=7137 RepID=A0ABM3MP48_GALME|nr:glutathione S-transferase 1-like isoform X2 [Galleria mellonella]
MPIKIYKMDLSPPARSVMMACEVHGITAEMIDVNLIEQEHKTPQYLKMNPLHTVPVLEDGDLIISDRYVADVYGKDDSLYPKDIKQRAMVNQKLFFSNSTLFHRLRNITYYVLIEGMKIVPQRLYDDIEEAYGFLEEFLSRSKFLAGDHMTIADIAAISTVTSLLYVHPHDSKKYPKTVAWIKEMEKQPFCQKYNAPGSALLGKLFNEKIKS